MRAVSPLTLKPLALLTLAALVALPAYSWDNCDQRADRHASETVDGIEKIEIRARAGDLRVEGSDGATEVRVKGKACASSDSLLEEVQIKIERAGSTLRVIAEVPESSGWRQAAALDLEIDVPAGVPVDVDDSSGDVSLRGVTLGRVDDGSGDLYARDTSGTVDLDDGSGDVRFQGHRGDVTVEDGSGDVRLTEIEGSIRVRSDGSGDLEMETVSGSVEVESDGSGDIFAAQVAGDFRVRSAGSGEVRHRDVAGRVDVPTRD